MEDKVIRKFKDNRGNKYVIYRKSNGHYRLVKFINNVGIIVATTKETIFNYLKEMHKEMIYKSIENLRRNKNGR